MAFTQQFLLDSSSGTHFIAVTGSFGLDSAPYDGNSLLVDSNGSIYFPAYYREDTSYPWLPNSGWIGQYSESGVLRWQRAIGGSDATVWGGGNELINDCCLSPDEQYLYVVGHHDANTGLIYKYDTSGNIQWKKQFSDSNTNQIRGCVIDSSGNLYVAGKHQNTGASVYKGFIAKFNSSGAVQWQKLFGSANRVSFNSIAIDSSDNIYLSGSIDSGPADNLVVKYNTSGSIVWQKRVTRGSSNYWESSMSCSVDTSGNVYITGFSNHDSSIDDQPYLLKMNSSGVFQWARYFGNYGNSQDNRIESATCDQDYNVYMIGMDKTNISTGNKHALVVKLNSSGTVQWKRTLGMNAAGYDAYTIKADSRNNIILGGDFWSSGGTGGYGSSDYFLAKLPNDGSKTGTYSLNSGSWVYQSTTMTVGTSSGWTISNAGQSQSNGGYSVANNSLSETRYTHSSATSVI